jgi:uncharacterized protein YggE
MSRRAVIALVGLVTAGMLVAGCTTPGASAADEGRDAQPRTITGTATGEVQGTPDTLTVTLGVESRSPSAQEALARNSERATKVIEALKAAGVQPADLQTSQLSLYPTFDNRGRPTGYSVSNMVTATTHDVPNAGAIVDAAAAQAGDDIRVQGVALSIEDTSDLVARARADAVRRARAQARQLARAADVKLGPLQRISERRPSTGMYPTLQAADSAALRVAPIEPGSQELTVDVTVVYTIA